VQGQAYPAGSVVSYSGLLYLAKYANPGYNPTVSTYYWARYDCANLSTAPACSSTVSNWTQGLSYAASAVVSYNGSPYIAKYANPGYNPTTSTYYWASYACKSSAPTCTDPIAGWVQGQSYAAGAVVSYQGLQYVAKYANPGYNPSVSTYYWAPVGSWVQGKSYAAGSVVTYSGSTYKAKYANPGYNPTISTYYWSKLGC
jgi:chitodextrinase